MPRKRTTGDHLQGVRDDQPPFTKAEARRFTDSIRADVQALWEKVHEAHERKAWAALGYDSFAVYMHEEFGVAKAQAYRLLDAGSIVRELSPPPPLPRIEYPIGDWRAEAAEREKQRKMEEVTDVFPPVASVPPPTRLAQTRELRPLLWSRKAMLHAWQEVVERHGPDPTGPQVRRVVRARVEELKRPEEKLPHRLRELDRCLSGMDLRASELTAILDDEGWVPVEDGTLFDAPPEMRDRWITAAESVNGAIVEALRRLRSDIDISVVCATCHGAGVVPINDDPDHPVFTICTCGGSGRVRAERE